MGKNKKNKVRHFLGSLVIVIAVVLIWRGIWYALDKLDHWIVGDFHILTAIGSVVLGVVLLYIFEKDLQEIV